MAYSKDYFDMNQAEKQAYDAGYAHASIGGKLKANPHPGGMPDDSPKWWAWNHGYKTCMKINERFKRLERGV